VPLVILRDKSSAKDAAGLIVSVVREKTGEDEISPKEKKGLAQAAMSLKKRMKAQAAISLNFCFFLLISSSSDP